MAEIVQKDLFSDNTQKAERASPFPSMESVVASVFPPGHGRVHLVAKKEKPPAHIRTPETSGALAQTYFMEQGGAKKLACNMIMNAALFLASPPDDLSHERERDIEREWVRGRESKLSFRFCLELLGLESYQDRLSQKIIEQPDAAAKYFRQMYNDLDIDLDVDDQAYRVSGLGSPRMSA